MRRRAIIPMAAFIVTGVICSQFINHDRAHAAGVEKQKHTQGSLGVVDGKGKVAGECPLKHTSVKAEVSGFISRVTVTQDFENPFPDKIEAIYIFPLPQAAAVDDLTMQIGDRTIKGTIMRREDAAKAYESAKRLGKVASLLDQERPNIFTQQVANILPGQQIRVVISYVETLKYENGFYEWSFPMVVAPRYVSAGTTAAEASDTARISPPSAPEGMRAGHDISLELDLNTGVPILGANSETHEINVELESDRRAKVQLKDRATIPNKDFVLRYRVAGSSINDAVLTHRSERGGFFTLILQPPQRVTPEDVMPKELVFVVDTSGSMHGFALEKAKQTALFALDNLYPHDTFNVISFSGETRILFSDPVPATRDNLHKAKKFLSSLSDEGGTEMMKAIKAALEPSDSQHHVRIVCFMTDGQVGSDREILAEVQKYRNARVFAIGFGSSPNRYLLDTMAEYGRGEVDYVTQQGDTSSVARRFNERIRNPLLTNISIEWAGLPVTDVYPKHAPDLFDQRPLIFSGRYEHGAKGMIRLKGKLAGEDFVREIPVELPDSAPEHDVLATLWARRKIDDLMREEMSNLTPENAKEEKREQITQLGLGFKLMTRFTSFVAIDDVIFTDTDDARPIPVVVQPEPGSLSTGISEHVTVSSLPCCTYLVGGSFGTGSATVFMDNQTLPVQGRSFERFYLMAGTSVIRPGGLVQSPQTHLAPNGQHNNVTVDGHSMNFGITPGGESPGPTASGNVPAFTASGGANGIASLEAIFDINIQTYSMTAEYGRPAGAQVDVKSKAGTNEFHGSAFYVFGNDAFDASDWFANSRHLPKPEKKLNFFGGTFGGPLKKNQTFLFASYEGMRFRQPMAGITDVPSLSARNAATGAVRSLLNAFPIPNGPVRPDGFAEFAASFANPARHDIGSIRLDQIITSKLSLRGRYSFVDSEADQRGGDRLSLNTLNQIRSRSHVVTGLASYTPGPESIIEIFTNYSRLRTSGAYLLDQFGGATLPDSTFGPGSFVFDLNSPSAGWMVGDTGASVQRQFSLGGAVQKVEGNHNFKFGGDYRRLSPTIGMRTSQQSLFFDGVNQALAGEVGRISNLNHAGPQNPDFESFSLFAQDQWKVHPRFTLNYGMRWDVAPAPAVDGEPALAVDQIRDPSTLKLAAPGTSLWRTTFTNIAPLAGFAYDLNPNGDEFVLRAGIGILYDVGHGSAGNLYANSIPFLSTAQPMGWPQSASPTTNSLPFVAFDPQLKLPYTINWNVSIFRALGRAHNVSAAFVSLKGRRLLHTETLFDENPDFPFLRPTTNRGRSDYRALGLAFNRKMADGLMFSAAYTWSRSLDNVTTDSERAIVMTSRNPDLDRGPSDFDVRHTLTGFLSYTLPAVSRWGLKNKLTRNWVISSLFETRSAKPIDVAHLFPTSVGIAFLRPEGSSGRNSLRGFPLYQVDLGLQRKFNFTEEVALIVGAESFNVLNHTNFEDPSGSNLVIGSPGLLESRSLSGRNLSSGGFPSFYGSGGPRTMKVTVKLRF